MGPGYIPGLNFDFKIETFLNVTFFMNGNFSKIVHLKNSVKLHSVKGVYFYKIT